MSSLLTLPRVLLILIAFGASALGWHSTAEVAPAQTRPAVTVTRVIDGDTIEISPAIDGKEEVRLIGVDTPETVDPDSQAQPYGPVASRFTKSELEDERVELEFDQEQEDQFGKGVPWNARSPWGNRTGAMRTS